MSTEEDTELRDLLQQTLENNGSLAKIRAQLRASVFMAFHEDEEIQQKAMLLNPKISKHLEQPEGRLLFAIVHEFLEYFELDYTLSVFKAESNMDSYVETSRPKLLHKLQLKNSEQSPILLQLLQKLSTSKAKVPLELSKSFKDSSLEDIQDTLVLNKTYDVPAHNQSAGADRKQSKESTPRSLELISENRDETVSSIAEDSIHTNVKESSFSQDNNSIDSQLHLTLSLQDQYSNSIAANNCLSPTTPEKQCKLKGDQLLSGKSPRTSPEFNLPANKSPRGGDLILPTFYNSNPSYDDGLDSYEEDFMVSSDNK